MHCVHLTLTHFFGQVFEERLIQEHAEVVKDKGGPWLTRITRTAHVFHLITVGLST